jgi:hypothetical protein
MTVPISQAADDLIVACEVGSRAQYEKKYRRPEWPGGASGVTVGIGYDLGYATTAKIGRDWGDRLPGSMVDAMRRCAGVTHDAARSLTAEVRNEIDVSWDNGIAVYEITDIPEWTQRVCDAIPGADKLSPDCIGALTSLAYNRGASFKNQGDRYREMRAIRSHVMAGQIDHVDDEIRAMKRLWGNDQRGLLIRRDKEADLWNKGLVNAKFDLPPPVKSVPKEAPPPLVPTPKSGGAEAGTAAATTTTTGVTAQQAAAGGMGPLAIGCIILAGVVITVGSVAYIQYRRSQPVMARAKG